MTKIFVVILVLIIVVNCWPKPKANWSGQLAPYEPVQSTDNLPTSPIINKDFTIVPKAHYTIKAVVLSKHHYWANQDADYLAPFDVALGWGPMSDARNINALRITQDGRWYNYSWHKSPPIDASEIASHSSNTHLIYADNQILNKIKKIKYHQLITLKGYLVDVTRKDGWHWQSSMSRNDTGGGACEVMYVTAVE